MKGDVGGEGGFAHRRAAREDNQVRAMKTAHFGVQPGQAGAVTGQAAVIFKGNRRLVDCGRGDILERPQSGAGFPCLGKLEQLCLRGFDLVRCRKVDIGVAGVTDDVVADTDQLAAEMSLVDGRSIIGSLRDADDTVGKFAEIILDFGGLAFFRGAEERLQGHRVRQLAAIYQPHHRRKDPAVKRVVEMFGPQPVIDPLHDTVVEKQRTKQVLLCGKIVRHLKRGADTRYPARPAGKGFNVACFFGHRRTIANRSGCHVMLFLWRSGITEKIAPDAARGRSRAKKSRG